MITNLHTHTTFSDGENTPEEIVLTALEQGFCSIGFSDHAYTSYDISYCMNDEKGYIKEVRRLQEKYKKEIEIYLGIEEDSHSLVNRLDFDYIIGSCHYIKSGEKHYSIDGNAHSFSQCLAVFKNDEMAFAENYFQHFCEYSLSRKPDIIGHFDLITKFDEKEKNRYLQNPSYWNLVERYCLHALKSGGIFEVNTGLVARGYRSSFFPHERLLRLIYKNGGKITFSSDSHEIKTLQGCFDEVRAMVKEIGFQYIYIFQKGEWAKKLFKIMG